MGDKRFTLKSFAKDDKPLLADVLSSATPATLAPLLKSEHPQTIAIVLAHLDAKRCGETLKLLPAALHAEIITRIAKLETVDPRTLDDLAETFEKLLRDAEQHRALPKGGIALVASLLTNLDKVLGDRL